LRFCLTGSATAFKSNRFFLIFFSISFQADLDDDEGDEVDDDDLEEAASPESVPASSTTAQGEEHIQKKQKPSEEYIEK
jgi:hypothetical protein